MIPGFRIGCTGAGGTGKTTTASFLASEFNLVQTSSASRKVYEELNLNENKVLDMSVKEKWDLQIKIFDEKIWLDDNTQSFVADRTLLDHWAYCLMYCAGHINNDLFEKYETIVRKHMLSSYSVLLYFPWGYWSAEGDGVRSDNMAWQSAIDAIIGGYCFRWNIPVVALPQGNGKEHRNEYAKAIIMDRLGLNKKENA